MNCFQKFHVCALLSLSVLSAKAQTTYMEMEQLTVNDQVTTVITASEQSSSPQKHIKSRIRIIVFSSKHKNEGIW